jgi:hypothetical protein
MAYSGTVPAWDKKFEQGISHWGNAGSALITQMQSMMNTHTHGGTPDGTAIPTSTLSSAARTKTTMVTLVDAAQDTTVTVPIFKGPATCRAAISAIYWIPTANVVGQDTNYLTLTITNKGTAGAGTTNMGLVTMNAAGGTALANVAKSITGAAGVISPNEVLVITKGTQGSGLQLPASYLAIDWTTIDAA